MPERLNQERAFDVLGDILETLRFRGSVFFRSDLAAPWGMSLTSDGTPRFHIVLSGECFVGADGHADVRAGETDIIMLPNGSAHWIADRPGRDLVPSVRAGEACELGNPLFQQGAITNRLICGMVNFEQGASHPIVDALPEVMHFSNIEEAGPIWSVVTLIDAEMRGNDGRSNRIADRLTEVLFLQLLNHYVSDNEGAKGFLAALRDRRVHRALMLIHQEPEFDWSLSALGERAGMSKATLVRRFQDVVGVAPMAYITDWRIMKAHSLIKHSATPLEQVADATGFASARTLSRTFKRHYGCTPHELRRSRDEA
ncbi:MAG: AraC family transcriptional regulator [Gammaproteobacteria bacterium]